MPIDQLQRGVERGAARIDDADTVRLPWWWSASLVLLALALAAYRLAHTEADPDLWGHVRFGLDLIETGRVARPDDYSYLTGGIPWINHEWLSELLMALAYRGAGATGLIALKTALGLAVAVLVARHLRRQRLSLLTTLFITAYGMVVLYPGLRPMRPQAFTYLCMTLVLLLIARAMPTGSASGGDDATWSDAWRVDRRAWPSSLWWVVPIMACWANLHGGFVAGLGLLALWWASRAGAAWLARMPAGDADRRADAVPVREDSGESTRNRRAPDRRASQGLARDGLIVLAAFAATLVNPYGWDMWRFLGRTLVPRPEISEWQALPIASLEGVTYALVCALGIVGLLRQPWTRRAVTLPMLVCGVALPLMARRHLPLLALIVLVLCAGDAAHALGDAIRRRWPRMQQASSQRGRPLLAAALVIEAVVILALARPEWTRIVVDPESYPLAATARLAATTGHANVIVFFDWGEYVLWHAGPRIKVSVDGRRETVYPDDVYAENMAFTEGAGDWDRLLARTTTDAALVSVNTPAAALMALHPDWELVLRDGPGALYGRRGAPFTAALHAAGASGVAASGASAAPSAEIVRSLERSATFP